MTLRHLTLGGAAAIALAALVSGAAISATPATTTVRTTATTTIAGPTTPLDKVSNPTTALAKLTVVNKDGVKIGTVVDVVTRSDGKAISLTVDASPLYGGQRHWVGIEATKMGLDPTRRFLVANMTNAEIKALPSLL